MNNVKPMKIILVAMTASVLSSYAYAQQFTAELSGFNEVPAAILSPGTGTLTLTLDPRASTLTYALTYSALTSPVTQAHIHFGKEHVAGGIMVFFCSNQMGPPQGTPACPDSGTVSGTITANGVTAIEAQNVTAGDFNAVVTALTSGTSYANVHSARFPAGEIRGEIRP
jgi:hypothetical protein